MCMSIALGADKVAVILFTCISNKFSFTVLPMLIVGAPQQPLTLLKIIIRQAQPIVQVTHRLSEQFKISLNCMSLIVVHSLVHAPFTSQIVRRHLPIVRMCTLIARSALLEGEMWLQDTATQCVLSVLVEVKQLRITL